MIFLDADIAAYVLVFCIESIDYPYPSSISFLCRNTVAIALFVVFIL